MDERRVVEDIGENEIKEYNDFQNSMYAYNDEETKPKKTIIARIIIKYQKKKVQTTEINFKDEIKDSIAEEMDWDNLKKEENEEELPQLPISNKSGEEVLELKKKSYTELKIATKEVEEVLRSSSENSIFSDELFSEDKNQIVKLLKKTIKAGEITKEDRKILVDVYGEDAIQLLEQSI